MSTTELEEGRVCPIDYRYPPESLDRAPDLRGETLLVVGGLYGNVPALDAVVASRDEEPGPVTVIFNGDFNWLNVDDFGFEKINRFVLGEAALRGNVETELTRADPAAGCGCAYPDWVDPEEVRASNDIMRRLAETAGRHPDLIPGLAALPMTLVAEVGSIRVGIVHGDAVSLAGWMFSHRSVSDPQAGPELTGWFRRANVRLFASTHTGLPVARMFSVESRACAVVNNGAAGLPNFAGARHGLMTRISTRPPKWNRALYGFRVGDVHVDAIPVRYDASAWDVAFRNNWPPGSPGYRSYARRIRSGPRYTETEAVGPGVSTSPGARTTAERTGPAGGPESP